MDTRAWAVVSLLICSACEAPSESDDATDEEAMNGEPGSLTGSDCDYPAGAVEPMTLGEVLTPYAWGEALHADGRSAMLNLADAPCGADATIEWSPHDVLMFVSVPAW